MQTGDTLILIIAIVAGYATLFLTMWLFRKKKNANSEKSSKL